MKRGLPSMRRDAAAIAAPAILLQSQARHLQAVQAQPPAYRLCPLQLLLEETARAAMPAAEVNAAALLQLHLLRQRVLINVTTSPRIRRLASRAERARAWVF
jgi:hypothetical protein